MQFDSWSDGDEPLQLRLLVPPGQLDLGERLITTMYSSRPNLSDLTDEQLLQLAVLADCYGVSKVLTAAAAQLQKKGVHGMPLATAAAVFSLPEVCLELGSLSQLHKLAGDKLQQELGDLEVVWGDQHKQQQLLDLPFGALLRLLRDERTRVASEDTAVYTAQRWLATNATCGTAASRRQQQQQLAGVLRLPHCTSTFLLALARKGLPSAADCTWVADGDAQLLMDLGMMAARPAGFSCEHSYYGYGHHWALSQKPAWQQPRRPASVVTELKLTLHIPVAPPKASGSSAKQQAVWQGREWSWDCLWSASNIGAGLRLLRQQCGADCAFCRSALGFSTTRGEFIPVHGGEVEQYLSRGGMGGPVLCCRPGTEWPQTKVWLQEQGYVHADGCLHLSATIKQVG
jgi:hypothetical protein